MLVIRPNFFSVNNWVCGILMPIEMVIFFSVMRGIAASWPFFKKPLEVNQENMYCNFVQILIACTFCIISTSLPNLYKGWPAWFLLNDKGNPQKKKKKSYRS